MTSNIDCLSKFHSMTPDNQAAVRWGIWVLEGMQEELGFSERIISTDPSCPSIEKAIKLFETNGRNVTPPQVKKDVQKMVHGFFTVRAGISGNYSIATQAIMGISPLTKDILSAVLIKNGHSAEVNKVNSEELFLQALYNAETSAIEEAVLRMHSKITS